MLLRRLTVAAAAIGLCTAVVVPAASASAAPRQATGTASLAALLTADGDRFDDNADDFDIVTEAVLAVVAAKPDSPVAVLADGSVPVTAFLPTDRAFRNLAYQLTGQWITVERKLFTTLVQVLGVDTIESVLLYHVVPGSTLTAADVLGGGRATLTTALGSPIRVDVVSRSSAIVRLRDLDYSDKDPYLVTSALDLNAGNRQIAHAVTAVLRPVNLP